MPAIKKSAPVLDKTPQGDVEEVEICGVCGLPITDDEDTNECMCDDDQDEDDDLDEDESDEEDEIDEDDDNAESEDEEEQDLCDDCGEFVDDCACDEDEDDE